MENRELLDLKNNGTIAPNSHVFYVVGSLSLALDFFRISTKFNELLAQRQKKKVFVQMRVKAPELCCVV